MWLAYKCAERVILIWGGMEMNSARKTTVMALVIAPLCSFEKDRLSAKIKPNPLKNIHFGGQHLHMNGSPDALAMGTRNTADDAYNFAKEKPIKKSTSGEFVQKKSPLR